MLNRFKKYIGLFFLWAFVVPQVNNVLHFVIVHHTYNTNLNNKPEFNDHKDVHFCSQHLFHLTSVILVNALSISIPIDVIYKNVIIQKSFLVLRLLNIGLFLRGPPNISF